MGEVSRRVQEGTAGFYKGEQPLQPLSVASPTWPFPLIGFTRLLAEGEAGDLRLVKHWNREVVEPPFLENRFNKCLPGWSKSRIGRKGWIRWSLRALHFYDPMAYCI